VSHPGFFVAGAIGVFVSQAPVQEIKELIK
jgi:hypothetical protein